MIIARQKRKENIAEYLLYMWQVEDLIRANKFDMDSINRTVIAHYDQPEEVKKEIAQWYEELRRGDGERSYPIEQECDYYFDRFASPSFEISERDGL